MGPGFRQDDREGDRDAPEHIDLPLPIPFPWRDTTSFPERE